MNADPMCSLADSEELQLTLCWQHESRKEIEANDGILYQSEVRTYWGQSEQQRIHKGY
jgi:hypothetical protein